MLNLEENNFFAIQLRVFVVYMLYVYIYLHNNIAVVMSEIMITHRVML
jgi:hypothetical protein